MYPVMLRQRNMSAWRLLVVSVSLLVSGVSGQQCSKLTTFNTGLTPTVAEISKREALIQKAIQQSTTDVMCLQEAWFETSVDALMTAGKERFPYSYSHLHSRVNQLSRRPANGWLSWMVPDAPCSARELSYIVTEIGGCALRSLCVSLSAERNGECLARACKTELKSRQISQSCLACTMFSFGSIQDSMTKCGNVPGYQKSRFNSPGLLLLSRLPISSARYVDFHPGKKLFVQRGYIEAEIQGLGKVVCTHLSAQFEKYFEFDTDYTSFRQQQLAEIQALSRFRDSAHILLGDLNTGPALSFPDKKRNVAASYPHNYRQLVLMGYKSPYVEQVRLCTYCTTNLYSDGYKSYILDHVMPNGDSYADVTARRTLLIQDRQVMSDHYGVEVRLCPLDYRRRQQESQTQTRTTSQRGFLRRFFG